MRGTKGFGGKANPMSIAEPLQFVVDKLAPVVRVQELDWERQVREDTGERIEDVTLRTAGDRDDLRPSRTAVRDGEGVTVIPGCLPSIMTHEVHLHIARSNSRELPGRNDGNESGQAPWFCSGSMPPVPSLGLLLPKQAVHGGRAHLEEGSRERIRKSGSMSCHGAQELRHGCLQSLATELSGKVIHPDKRHHHGRTVDVLSVSGPGRGPRWNQGHCSQDHALCIGAEQVCCIGRTVSCRDTELLQHDPFLFLPDTEIPQGNLPSDVLFLLH